MPAKLETNPQYYEDKILALMNDSSIFCGEFVKYMLDIKNHTQPANLLSAIQLLISHDLFRDTDSIKYFEMIVESTCPASLAQSLVILKKISQLTDENTHSIANVSCVVSFTVALEILFNNEMLSEFYATKHIANLANHPKPIELAQVIAMTRYSRLFDNMDPSLYFTLLSESQDPLDAYNKIYNENETAYDPSSPLNTPFRI